MLNTKQHVAALQQAYEVMLATAQQLEAVAAGVIGLYGLRVLATSAAYYPRPSIAEEFSQRWNLLKRETKAVGAALNRELDAASKALGIEALRYHPDYRNFQEDGLTQATLILDKLDVTVVQPEDEQVISQVVSSFLTHYLRDQVKLTTRLTTPSFLNELGAQLLTADIEDNCSVYDPACGVGGSLKAVHRKLAARGITGSNAAFFGQDVNRQAIFIAAWNLFLSGIKNFRLELDDTLREPRFLNGDELKRFNLVLTQPPAHYVTDDDFGSKDPYSRFRYGAVQSSRADYAFVQHVVASLQAGGRAVIVVPLTTLSRSGFEEEIRANLVHAGVLSASISFRGDLLLSKNTPAAMLSFDLAKPSSQTQDVLFIDAPVKQQYTSGNPSAPEATPVRTIVDIYRTRHTTKGLSKTASLEEVRAHQYSLVPQAYIPQEGSKSLNIDALDQETDVAAQEIFQAQFAFERALADLSRMRPQRRPAKRLVKPE